MSDKEKIREVIEKRYEYWKEKEFNSHSIESEVRMSECQHLLLMVDSIPEEHNEDLEEYYTKEFLPKEWFANPGHRTISQFNFFTARHFAEWQKQRMIEKAVEWIKQNVGDYWYDDYSIDCPEELIEDFKQAMKED